MADNLLIANLGPDRDALAAAAVRFRIFGSTNDLAATIASTKSVVTPGQFFAEFSGAAGVYFGHVEIDEGSGFAQSGALIGRFLWDGTDFADPATPAAVAAALAATADRVLTLSKRQGLEPGVSATVLDAAIAAPGSLTTSDNAIAQTLTLNLDGSVTIANTTV